MKTGRKNWAGKLTCVALLAIAVTAPTTVTGQNQQPDIQFNALYNCPNSSMYYFKVLSCNEKYCKAFYTNQSGKGGYEGEVSKYWILEAFKVGGCTINGQPLKSKPAAPPQTDVATAEPRAETGGTKQPAADKKESPAGRFKVGERVMASPMQMESNEEKYWEKCTVVKDYMITEGADAYQVKCDDPRGGKGSLGNVPPKYIRAWAGGTAEPPPPDCPFNEPPGRASKNAALSPALLKRVIYELYKYMHPNNQVGVTFTGFTLASTFRNSIANRGVFQSGAPQGGTIYRYKAEKVLLCIKNFDDTISQVESKGQYYQCFKDKSGDWACTEDGRVSWDQRTIRAK